MWLCRRAAVLLPLCRTTRLVQAGYRGRHHFAQAVCTRRITRRTAMEGRTAAAERCKGEQRRRATRQSRLVAPGGLRVAQRGDIASAVERLRLASETFTVNHSKRGGAQKYPLQREVGDAILEYIQKARPRSSSRNLFLTLKPPYRAIGYSSLWRITSRRMRSGRHPMPTTRTALSAACVCHSFAGTRRISEGDRGSAGPS